MTFSMEATCLHVQDALNGGRFCVYSSVYSTIELYTNTKNSVTKITERANQMQRGIIVWLQITQITQD